MVLKKKFTRLLYASILTTLTIMSLQSLKLKYIDLPAAHMAAIQLVKETHDKAQAIINDRDSQISNLQVNLLTSKSNEAAAKAAETAAKADALEADEANAETSKAADILLKDIKAKYMPVDQCVVFKRETCINGEDEIKGTKDDSVCDF